MCFIIFFDKSWINNQSIFCMLAISQLSHVYIVQYDQYLTCFSVSWLISRYKIWKKLGNYWLYCTRNRAITNAYRLHVKVSTFWLTKESAIFFLLCTLNIAVSLLNNNIRLPDYNIGCLVTTMDCLITNENFMLWNFVLFNITLTVPC